MTRLEGITVTTQFYLPPRRRTPIATRPQLPG